MGSRRPDDPDLVYGVNYGYVGGVFAGDGEEQDAYVPGVGGPMEEFEGTVIAVYRRLNDDEDKWIAAVDGRERTEDEILGAFGFRRSIRGRADPVTGSPAQVSPRVRTPRETAETAGRHRQFGRGFYGDRNRYGSRGRA